MILDIHSHILFGMDDGAQTLDHSRAMLDAASDAGISAIVASPHIYLPPRSGEQSGDGTVSRYRDETQYRPLIAPRSRTPIDPERLRAHFEMVRNEANQRGIDLIPGCELSFKVLEEEGPEAAWTYRIGGTRNVLVEFPFGLRIASHHISLLDDLLRKNIIPIIAHPERYESFTHDPSTLRELADIGCRFQVTARVMRGLSLPKPIQWLIKMNQLDFLGVDAHTAADYTDAAKIIKKYPQYFSAEKLDRPYR